MKIATKHFFWIFYSCLFVSIIAGFFVHSYLRPPTHFFWDAFPIFNAIYGFIGCIVVIVASKALGHRWLQKSEDYYEKHETLWGKDR